MISTSTTATTTIDMTTEDVFKLIVPINLSSIFTGYGPLPAVIKVCHQTGSWDAEGQTRTVVFSDGSTAQESLTCFEHPHHFAYSIEHFTGMLRFLVKGAHGEWWFEKAPDQSTTAIRWRYTFLAKSKLLEPLVCLFTQLVWRGYMRKALNLSKTIVESLRN